jgi:uncharacterized protein
MKNFIAFILIFYVVRSSAQIDPHVELSEQFIHYLAKKDFIKASSMFDARVGAKLDTAMLAKTWIMITSQAGDFESIKGFSSRKTGSMYVVVTHGKFKNAAIDIQTSFDSLNKINGIYFLPGKSDSEHQTASYVRSRKIKEKDIYIKTGDFLLPGTFTFHKCRRKMPLVILVHGSGPLDRDATIGPNKIFKDISHGLASNGIASIRYDKRTLIYATKMVERYGNHITIMEETVADALSAIDVAKTIRRKVDKNKIFVAGHSLGGMVAPRIANMRQGLAGMIIMAGNARPLEDLVLDQVRYLKEKGLGKGGLSELELMDIEKLERQVKMVRNPLLNIETPATELPLGLNASYWLDLNNYDQISAAKNAEIPIFILQGERDYQVTKKDFEIWKKELENIKDVKFKLYSDLNHLFMEGSGDSNPEEYNLSGNVSLIVIKDLTRWIKKEK